MSLLKLNTHHKKDIRKQRISPKSLTDSTVALTVCNIVKFKKLVTIPKVKYRSVYLHSDIVTVTTKVQQLFSSELFLTISSTHIKILSCSDKTTQLV